MIKKLKNSNLKIRTGKIYKVDKKLKKQAFKSRFI